MPGVELGKFLIIIGTTTIILGIIVMMVGKVPFIGKLPGDIHIEKESFSFYFPIVTCMLISVVLSFIFWLFSRR